MCGIVAICSRKEVSARLLDGLQRLEYRGYDSSGVATIIDDKIANRRAPGKLSNLREVVAQTPLTGTVGIGHTRWATHGIPNLANTHPHSNGAIALVHNGIIENHATLRQRLIEQGYSFASDTDSEVILHLIDSYVQQGHKPHQATTLTLKELAGAYSLAIIFADHKNLIIGARKGSPLAIGYGKDEMFLGSDRLALLPYTKRISYLQDGDIAVLSQESVEIFNDSDQSVTRDIQTIEDEEEQISKQGYHHFMAKEIFEQPEVIQKTLETYLSKDQKNVQLPDLPFDIVSVPKITIVACGTAFYAGMVTKYWLESIAKIPVEIDIASEFRYRDPPLPQNGLAIFISQSGETADTLAAHQFAKERGQHTIAVVNVPESSLARAADATLYTKAGPEIGVASTKAFTTQLATLACLTIDIAAKRAIIGSREVSSMVNTLCQLPNLVKQALALEDSIKTASECTTNVQSMLFLGRGPSYPIALEGALKLKELSYIHAEGLAAGEMKHGSIALIDKGTPVVVLAPTDKFLDKTISNMQEVIAREGQIVLIGDAEGSAKIIGEHIQHISLPPVDPFIAPIVYTIPMQLLAYHAANRRGANIDQPRNLAKSVTVE